MIALSIRQPWAWLIVHGFKPVENRVWSTPYRGPCLIHAGKTLSGGDYEIALNGLREALGRDHMPPVPPMHELPLGGFVGAVRVVDCVEQHPSPYFTGPYGFVMQGALALPFQPYRGMLNFFNVPSDVLRAWPGYCDLLHAGRTGAGGQLGTGHHPHAGEVGRLATDVAPRVAMAVVQQCRVHVVDAVASDLPHILRRELGPEEGGAASRAPDQELHDAAAGQPATASQQEEASVLRALHAAGQRALHAADASAGSARVVAAVMYGPPGCGKSQAAAAVRSQLDLQRVVDHWIPGSALPPGALAVMQTARMPRPSPLAEATV